MKYAYIKMQGEVKDSKSNAQQHVESNKQLHVQEESEWVYLIVSPWSEEQFISVPPSPARYSIQQQGEQQFIKVSSSQYCIEEKDGEERSAE